MNQAPVFVQAFDVAAWLLRQVKGGDALPQAVHRDALAMLDHVVLALKGVDRAHHVDRADAVNAVLRVRLRLAHEVGLLNERQLLYVAGELDEIGRQLGGWLRSLPPEEP